MAECTCVETSWFREQFPPKPSPARHSCEYVKERNVLVDAAYKEAGRTVTRAFGVTDKDREIRIGIAARARIEARLYELAHPEKFQGPETVITPVPELDTVVIGPVAPNA